MSPLALSLRFLQTQPDGRLVELARQGHEPAFEALVRRYRRELLSYCRRLQPQSAEAEDALQLTLLQAWRVLSTGAEVRQVRPWLYRIAHNVTLNQLRAHIAIPQAIPDVASGLEVGDLVEQRRQAGAALTGMASLPEVQRQVFVSTVLDGASHEEVASMLGLSSGAVRGLIFRARAALRAAAAAIIPSPVVHWAIRRVHTTPRAAAISETLAGGSGASIAVVLAKGGAVLTLAGAVAGTSGLVLTQHSGHHPPAQRSHSYPRRQTTRTADRASRVLISSPPGVTHRDPGQTSVTGARAPAQPDRHGRGSDRGNRGRDRQDGTGSSSAKPSAGRDGGSGGGSSDSNGSRGSGELVGSTGGSSGSDGATSSTFGSRDTTSGGDGSTTTTSDGGPGSDGGSSGSSSDGGSSGSSSSSGSGDTTTTSSGSH